MSYNAVLSNILITNLESFKAAMHELSNDYGIQISEPVSYGLGRAVYVNGIPVYLDQKKVDSGIAYTMRVDTDHNVHLGKMFGISTEQVSRYMNDPQTSAPIYNKDYQRQLDEQAELVLGPLSQRYSVVEIENQCRAAGYITSRSLDAEGSISVVAQTI